VALMHCGGFGEVKRLFVAAAGRGLGVARALMAALEADAVAQGLAQVLLETSDRLVPAVTLYTSLGYRVRGKFGDYDDHPASLFMGKDVGVA
jgi:putative acetyltransferase